jgi:dTDP-4-dehydrorhamnose reductase
MRIFITGITGFIGSRLAHFWQQQNDWTIGGTGRASERPATLPSSVQYYPVDFSNLEILNNALHSFMPDVVVHSAAMSKPNDCEVQQELCTLINVEATAAVVAACEKMNCRLLFISTDFVFGDDGPFAENDVYDPVNFYGLSKVRAEELVKASGIDWSIVRTVLVYGKQAAGMNATFPQWVKNNLEKGKTIRVFTDQYRTATYVDDLVDGIDRIIHQHAKGVFHLSGAETTTPFEFARKVACYLGYDPSMVEPTTRIEMPEAARRPIRSTLNIAKAKSELGYAPRSLDVVLPLLF